MCIARIVLHRNGSLANGVLGFPQFKAAIHTVNLGKATLAKKLRGALATIAMEAIDDQWQGFVRVCDKAFDAIVIQQGSIGQMAIIK